MSWTTIPQLLEQVRNPEDGAAWARFVEKYRPLLTGYAKSKGLSDADAEDVVQEVLIRLLRLMTAFERDAEAGTLVPKFAYDPKRGKFRTWLYQITLNALRECLRKRPPAAAALIVEPEQPDANWNQLYEQEILQVALAQIQSQVLEKSWTCFEEFVLKGRKGGEIAREVGLTPNAVRVNANRVLEKVRALCAEYLAEDDHEQAGMPQPGIVAVGGAR